MIKHICVSIAALAVLAACSRNAPSQTELPHVKAHDIQQLMQTVVEPQARIFWGSAGTVINMEGERDLTPTTDERWLATQSAAATVTEMGNLLMTPQFAEGRNADWIQFATSLAQIGMRAEKAVVDRNSDAIFETGGIMYNVCSACHQVYLPNPENSSAPQATQ